MNTNSGGASNFFTGGFQPDHRVQQVLSKVEDDFYKERQRQEQMDDYYRRQAHQANLEQQLQEQQVRDNEVLL